MAKDIFIAQVPRCRSCGAPILWAVTEKGKRMPVDLEPVPGGNIVLDYAGDGSDPVARYGRQRGEALASQLTLDGDEKGYAYVSHFATCPQRKEWRNDGS